MCKYMTFQAACLRQLQSRSPGRPGISMCLFAIQVISAHQLQEAHMEENEAAAHTRTLIGSSQQPVICRTSCGHLALVKVLASTAQI